MPDKVICNTSPLFYLYRVKHLDILEKLYGKITVPVTVEEELKEGKNHGEDVPDLSNHNWIQIDNAQVPKLIKVITDLGPGEAGAIALALQESNSLLILDDRLARQIAELQGLKVTGTAGVLLKAKQNGYLDAVAPIVDQLLDLGFRLSDHLRRNILDLADETPD